MNQKKTKGSYPLLYESTQKKISYGKKNKKREYKTKMSIISQTITNNIITGLAFRLNNNKDTCKKLFLCCY